MNMKHILPLLVFLCLATRTLPQGTLIPPGPPATTMKSLDQIASTGTAINDTNTPGDADYHYVITAPGSYFLTSNLDVTKTNGIHITAASVTVDLNGFLISRGSGSGGDGITIDPTAHRCTIKNGNVTGFANGIYCNAFQGPPAHGGAFLQVTAAGCSDTGISAGESWQLEGCHAHDNPNTGILTGQGCTLSDCTASYNGTGGFGFGIIAGQGCILKNCAAYNNQAADSIFAGYGSTLMNCVVQRNAGSYGIFAQGGSTLINCTAVFNQVTWGIYTDTGCALTNCSSSQNDSAQATSGGFHVSDGSSLIGCTANLISTSASPTITTGMGIDADSGVTITNCTTRSNAGDGIRVSSNCLVSGCTSSDNGDNAGNGLNGGIGDGIRTTSDNNRLDGNHLMNNSLYGIRSAGNDYIVRNTASRNGTANYNPSSGPYFGPLQTPATVNASPWANF